MRNETRGAVFKKQQFITVCYSTCVRIEMKQEGQFSKKKHNLLQYAIQLVCILKWNKIGQFCEMKQEGQFSKNNNLLQYAIQLVCVLKWNKRDSFQKKNTNLLQYAIQLVCILKWNKMDSFQKNPINDNMLLNLCAKWNKRGSFQKTTIYYSMLFNLCAYWNETRGIVLCGKWNKRGSFQKKNNLLQYAEGNETRGAVFKKQQFITVCYSTCMRIEMKQEGQFSKNNNLLQYAIQLVCVLKWNKRDSFQKKTTIYYSMLFNLCAYWNETRSFQKNPIDDNMFSKWNKKFSKNNNLLQYAIQLVCILKWNKMDSFQKNPINDNMLLNLCAKWNKRGSFQKTTIYYSMLFNLCPYWNETRGTVFKKKTIYYSMLFNKRGSFQKTTIYYCMLFNLCAYWNETRGTVFKKNNLTVWYYLCAYWNDSFQKKKQQFITVCYSTCVHIEMKQEGQFSKKSNWWQYATELAKWNKRGSFQKTTIYYCMLFNLCAYWNETRGDSFQKKQFITVCYSTCVRIEMKQEGQFSKKKTIYYSSFQKTTIYYSMLFNLCAYWNETRWTVFKKIQLMTICYLIVSEKTRGAVIQKTTIYYSMLFNLCAYWNETRGAVFKKQQFITVCYSTCVRIEMKQEGQFSKNNNLLQYAIQLVCVLKWNKRDSFQKKNNLLQYAIQLVCILKWNKRGSFQKNPIDELNSCAKWNKRAVFKKQQFITVCYSTCVRIEMKQDGQFSKKSN